jgi:general stress protein 26
MAKKTLADLSKKMRKIDIAMLSTLAEGGEIAGRPMSNNGEVDYDGESYYFTWEKSRMVSDIKRDPKVSLAFQGDKGFLVAVQGEAELSRDKTDFKEHWTPDLDQWFKDGVDTKGLVMIKVNA